MQTTRMQNQTDTQMRRRAGGGERILRLAAVVVLLSLLGLPTAAPAAGADDDRRRGDGHARGTHVESEEAFRWSNEQFYYSLRVNGAEAMRATIKVGDLRKIDRGRYIPIGLSVRSRGFFDNVYSVDDRADTFMNPRTMQPYRSEKYFREAGKSRTYIVDYSHQGYRAQVEKKKPDKTHHFKKAIPSTTHDMVTWLYDLRQRDYSLGDTYRYYVYDGWKLSHVHMTVVGKEDLYTPAGWFKAWKFRFVRKVLKSKHNRQGGQAAAPILRMKSPREHTGHFWLSRDENHLPLRVTIPTSFGFGEAVLMKYNRPDRR